VFVGNCSTAMAHDVNLEMIHQIFGDFIGSANHDLIDVLKIF
jgi:hypothetical protein